MTTETTTTTIPALLPHALQPVHFPDGSWVPRMWDLALASTDREEASSFLTMKMIAASHGYDARYVNQEVPDELIDADSAEILAAVAPPTDAPVDGILVGRTVDEDGIFNWYARPAAPSPSPAAPSSAQPDIQASSHAICGVPPFGKPSVSTSSHWGAQPSQGGSVTEVATVAMVIPYTDEDDKPDMPEWRMITIGRPGDIPDHVLDRIPAKAADILCDAINGAARASAPEVAEKPILWCVHHIGPDDLHPVESYEAAVKMADAINDYAEKFNFGHKPDSINYVYSRAYPAVWTGTPESHAEWLEKRRAAALRSAGEGK